MAEAIHLIDPSADTILVLKNPGVPFGVWSEDWGFPSAVESNDLSLGARWRKMRKERKEKERKEKERKEKERKGEKTAVADRDEPPLVSDPMESSSVACDSSSGGGQSSMPEATSTSQFGLKEAQLGEPEAPAVLVEEEESGIHYRVSSRHLALASRFFKISLKKDGWKEGRPNAADGMYHLSAADWDPEAFLILLNVLHLRNRLIPRSLTLEMLAKMAVLADYYHCGEAVELFSEIWIDAAKQTSPIPSTYGRDLVLWMCIAWVFKRPVEFEQTTDIAVRQSKTPTIQDMCLPIPKVALDRMQIKRYQAIEKLLSSLHGWLDVFRGSSYACSRGSQYDFTCSSMLLGALTKEMDRIGCLSPRPYTPFRQLSCEEIYSKVHEMTSPTWSEVRSGYNATRHPCNFEDTVKSDVARLKEQLSGLDLHDFKERSSDGG